eukprot:6359644-Heterocapsa_arctica.AAC.1
MTQVVWSLFLLESRRTMCCSEHPVHVPKPRVKACGSCIMQEDWGWTCLGAMARGLRSSCWTPLICAIQPRDFVCGV